MANLWYKSSPRELKYTEIYFDSRDVKSQVAAFGSDPTNFEFLLSKTLTNIVGFQLLEFTWIKAAAPNLDVHIVTNLSPDIPKASTFVTAPLQQSIGKVMTHSYNPIGPGGCQLFNQILSKEAFTKNPCGPQNLSKLVIKLFSISNPAGVPAYVLSNITNFPGVGFDNTAGDWISGTIGVWML